MTLNDDTHFHRIQFLVRVVDSYKKAHFLDQLDYFLRRKDTGPLEFYYRTAEQWRDSVVPHVTTRYVRDSLIPALRSVGLIHTDRRQHGGLSFYLDYNRLLELAYDRGIIAPNWCIDAANDPAFGAGQQVPIPGKWESDSPDWGVQYPESGDRMPEKRELLYTDEEKDEREDKHIPLSEIPYW